MGQIGANEPTYSQVHILQRDHGIVEPSSSNPRGTGELCFAKKEGWDSRSVLGALN